MKLETILNAVKTNFEIKNFQNLNIEDIAIDSRLIKQSKNSIFFALKGTKTNGEKYISQAIENGAKIIVANDFYPQKDIISIKSNDTYSLLVEFLQKLYPDLPKNIYVITGTNGKTSTAEFLRQMLELINKKSASIGTVGINCDKKIKPNLQKIELTTPDIVNLYKNLAILKENNIDDVALEASSIGIEQGRLNGLDINVGAFTNFSIDHLDYHKDMQEYFSCKMQLFQNILPNSSTAVLNSDIKEFNEIEKICNNKNHQIIDYGFNAKCLKINKISQSGEFSFFYKEKKYQASVKIAGDFQIFNLICALGMVLAKYNLKEEELLNLCTRFNKITPALGRMQEIANYNGGQIFIDFAHSPDALRNVLENARKLKPKRLIVMLGCGGDRDKQKRPLMGKIANDLADLTIVTDDNPRNEIPANIRKEIIKACNPQKTIEIDNRTHAIEKSLQMLKKGDILILAGKGHEKHQIINGEKIDFDEEKIVKEFIKK